MPHGRRDARVSFKRCCLGREGTPAFPNLLNRGGAALFRNGATLHRPDEKQNGRVLLPSLVGAELCGSRETKGKARTFFHCAGINLGWLVFPGIRGISRCSLGKVRRGDRPSRLAARVLPLYCGKAFGSGPKLGYFVIARFGCERILPDL